MMNNKKNEIIERLIEDFKTNEGKGASSFTVKLLRDKLRLFKLEDLILIENTERLKVPKNLGNF